jgi:hypothetical protein
MDRLLMRFSILSAWRSNFQVLKFDLVEFVACLLQQADHALFRSLPLLPFEHDLVQELALNIG